MILESALAGPERPPATAAPTSAPTARPAHLAPALIAVVLVLLALLGFERYAESIEGRSLEALAPLVFEQKTQGSALQEAALRRADLLPIYGASELVLYAGPYHAGRLFASFPTGFGVFPVGKEGATALIVLQDLAALGGDLDGKRVAITLSPTTYFNRRDMLLADAYQGNYSRLHAAATIFGNDLSPVLRRDVARRMVRKPDTLGRDPLLAFAAERLAADAWLESLLYRAAQPLGQVWLRTLRLQDHWETLEAIRQQPELTPPRRRAATLDWPSLAAAAEAEYRQQADDNPFGFDDEIWRVNQARLPQQFETRNDGGFLGALQQASEWTDLELLLRTIRELGAEPLILSQSIKGVYYDYQGVSAQARSRYYLRLEDLCRKYDVPLLDFADHDADPWFLRDLGSHLSPKGWVFFDEALDRFYRTGPPGLQAR